MDGTNHFTRTRLTQFIGGTLALCSIPAVLAEVSFDGSMGAPGTLQGANMEITADRGQLRGDNLFHSFSQFNINQGESANFSGPANVQNIFGRVTGNDASNIDGTLSSSIDGANLFLINPNGIMFGPNAQINITGSFHATTADYIKLGNNERLYADLNQNTSISVASPTAFGFLDNDVGDISVDGSNIATPTGSTLSLVGGDVIIKNGATLIAPDGQINIASTRSAGEFETALDQTDTNQFDSLGKIDITGNSMVDAGGSGGGRIVIRGGKLVADSSTVSADTEVYAMQVDPSIDIKTNKSITVDNGGKISTDLKMFADGTPSGIKISTENLNVTNNSSIQAETEYLSFGNAGNIRVNAKNIKLDNYSKLSTSTSSTGKSGSITVENAELLSITNASSIKTSADPFLGDGKSGDINIDADYIDIIGLENPLDPEIFDFTGIDAGYGILGGSDSGTIDVTTKNLTMSNSSQMRTISSGDSKTGNITISSDNFTVEKGAQIKSQSDNGNSGNITINNSEKLLITGISPYPHPVTNNFRISTIVIDGGDAHITINSDDIRVLDGATISSQNSLSQTASSGSISLTANIVEINGFNENYFNSLLTKGFSLEEANALARSQIRSSVLIDSNQFNTSSSAGSISIDTNDLVVKNKGKLEATSLSEFGFALTGESGNIDILAKNVLVNNGQLRTSASNANGGNINIDSKNSLIVDHAEFSSSVESENGNGGNIAISSKIVALDSSTFIATANAGNGGNININANTLLLPNTNSFNAHSNLALNGQITIKSNLTIEKDIQNIPMQFIDVTKSFANNCIDLKQNTKSSLRSKFTQIKQLRPVSLQPSDYNIVVANLTALDHKFRRAGILNINYPVILSLNSTQHNDSCN